MLRDVGANYVLLGHSERRTRHTETDDAVRRKAIQAVGAGMIAVICVGETREEKDADRTLDVLSKQISQSIPRVSSPDQIVIAYEPMWAIGTGATPTSSEIEAVHEHLRNEVLSHWGAGGDDISIIYGGSVTPANSVELLSLKSVDGLLIGGASLDPQKFSAIYEHAGATALKKGIRSEGERLLARCNRVS